MTLILAVAIAAIIFTYYKHTDFYKKRLMPNLAWVCAIALSTTKAWELAIQILIQDVTDQVLIDKSEMLLMHVDSILRASITIAAALIIITFVPIKLASNK